MSAPEKLTHVQLLELRAFAGGEAAQWEQGTYTRQMHEQFLRLLDEHAAQAAEIERLKAERDQAINDAEFTRKAARIAALNDSAEVAELRGELREARAQLQDLLMVKAVNATHRLACPRCRASLPACAYACRVCGTATPAGERVQEAAWLAESEPAPTADELEAMLVELDREDDRDDEGEGLNAILAQEGWVAK